MNTYSLQVVDTDGTVLTLTCDSFGGLLDMENKLKNYGWKRFNRNNSPALGGGRSTQPAQRPVVNLPANVPPCPFHPDGPMKPDNKNPGQYYCSNKVDGGGWCNYKASKDGVIRQSVLGDVQKTSSAQSSWDDIDF